MRAAFLTALGFPGPFEAKNVVFQAPASCVNFISPPWGRMTYINSLIVPIWLEQPGVSVPLVSELIKCRPQQLWKGRLTASWEARGASWSSKKDAIQLLGGRRAPISCLLCPYPTEGRSLQPSLKPTQPLWDLSLALLKQHFDELCVNESETYGFNFPWSVRGFKN